MLKNYKTTNSCFFYYCIKKIIDFINQIIKNNHTKKTCEKIDVVVHKNYDAEKSYDIIDNDEKNATIYQYNDIENNKIYQF